METFGVYATAAKLQIKPMTYQFFRIIIGYVIFFDTQYGRYIRLKITGKLIYCYSMIINHKLYI